MIGWDVTLLGECSSPLSTWHPMCLRRFQVAGETRLFAALARPGVVEVAHCPLDAGAIAVWIV